MKKLLAMILALVMVLTLLPAGAFAATKTFKASSKIMDYIKSKEGCELTAYKLAGEEYYTIGYGHYGPDVSKGQKITQAKADELFAQDLKRFENAVNDYNTKYKLNLTQNKFDALVSFTYNCGEYWINESWRIAKYARNGFKYENGDPVPDLEIADAFGVICNGGLAGLVKRRIEEARIFLYGDYDGSGSIDFVALICDPKGGTMTTGNKVFIYYKDQPYGNLPAVTKSGYVLQGWKTSDGFIGPATIAKKSLNVEASWVTAGTNSDYTLTVKNGTGSGKYKPGETVYINSVATPGSHFIGWESDGVEIRYDNSIRIYCITMPSRNVTVTALYEDGCMYGEYCPSAKFVDLDPKHWAHDGIDFCVMNGLFIGTGANTFSPEDPMTRAMIITVMYRWAGSPSVEGYTNPYADLGDDYYYDAVLWAYKNKILKSDPYKMFRPDEYVHREEFAYMLYKFASVLGVSTSSPRADLSSYCDAGSISSGNLTAMKWCVGHEIIIGMTDTTLEPASGATRAQVATMLFRFMQSCLAM